MKKLLRKWLDIPEPIDVNDIYDKVKIRQLIGEAVQALINGESDSRCSYYYPHYTPIKSSFVHLIEHTSSDYAHKISIETAKQYVDSKINTEEFIDSVVARIKNKQI